MNMFCGLTLILATVCISPIATAPQVATTAEKTPSPIGKLVDVGGYRVHLYCTGTGSPTVVILGAGYSFNWGLVQPEVAKLTQVCSYDHSGIGWSDTGPQDSCALRTNEAHTALRNLGIKGPYVLVGHSLGGLVARIYTARYPDEVAGMVFADSVGSALKPLPPDAGVPSPVSSPNKQSSLLSAGGIEDDPNFKNLSARDRELHFWGLSQTRNETARRTNANIIPQCLAEADSIAEEHPHPLEDKPLVDVSTDMNRNPNYLGVQATLLSLSQNSKEIIAARSGHYVMIDRPDAVIDAIGQVVRSLRNHSKLSHP
jgi:pimeloyl-ACP methyl ester carboxylesterase